MVLLTLVVSLYALFALQDIPAELDYGDYHSDAPAQHSALQYEGQLDYCYLPPMCDAFGWAVFGFNEGSEEKELATAAWFDPDDRDSLGLDTVTLGNRYQIDIANNCKLLRIAPLG